jgi:hypothetical protein
MKSPFYLPIKNVQIFAGAWRMKTYRRMKPIVRLSF